MLRWAAAALTGILAVVITPALGSAAPAGNITRVPKTQICTPNGHLIAHTHSGAAYAIRNNYWLGTHQQCILVRGDYPNFRVVQNAGHDARHHFVVAYPDIFKGCIWNICSPKGHLPRRVSRLGHIKSSWQTVENASGTWNASYDIWFGRKRMVTGQATGAELMIWLNEHGRCCALQPGAPKVKIEGHKWWLSHWRTSHNGFSWNYIQFRRVHPTWQVKQLKLQPFFRKVERMGLVKTHWWLENVETGYEIWSGGRGLQTTRFRVTHVRP
jgi:Glycosyl hydrolase family 12